MSTELPALKANDESRELTMTWKTLGLEDRQVEVARTLSLRDSSLDRGRAAQELVDELPRLLQQSERTTLPELRFKGTLGEGGMGIVKLAEQLSLGRDVAVKYVRDADPSNDASLVLLREGWTTGLLEHPNIVPIYTLGRNDNDDPVIVMKKIEGTSWLDIIEDPSCVPDGFDFDDPLELHVEILIQICNAIHYAHSRGIIHRDLKPENVMLGEFGEVYVLDWGIAVSVEEDPTGRLVSKGDITKPAGTPSYMAPEMVTGDGTALGTHTDIFLLGAMLYEALSGRPPYQGKTLFAVMLHAHDCEAPPLDEETPPELESICRRAMACDPGDRFASARALRDALVDHRRRRESRRLAAQSDRRLQDMRRVLKREADGEDVEEAALYRTFGECRFGYEQALEVAGNNQRARQGLQSALELMAERAIQRDAYKAASLLIADFPRPNETFERRLRQLEEKLASRRQDYKELQQIRHDVDVEVGRRSRGIFILVIGFFWVIHSLAAAVLVHLDVLQLTTGAMALHIVVMTAVVGTVIYLGRSWFFDNEINRRMLISVFTVFACVIVYRSTVWLTEITYQAAIALEFFVYGTSIFLLAIAYDRRLFIAGIPWLASALAGAVWPSIIMWLFAACNAFTVGYLAWMWWPKEARQSDCELIGSSR